MTEPAIRQAFAYAVICFFVVFFFSDGLSNHISTLRVPPGNNLPDFGQYQELRSLPEEQFPLEDDKKRVIVVGDIHGSYKYLNTLLKKISYEPSSDILVHVGDIITKGPHNGSMEVLSYMASNNITGVRGNHDQKVVEWRGWMKWINSLPGGRRWLEELNSKWGHAEASGASPDVWLEDEKRKYKSKWWQMIPEGWSLLGDHYSVAHAMTEAEYKYLLALPLVIHVPTAHAYIVHAGILPSDPQYSHDHRRQPLARIPHLPTQFKGKTPSKHETYRILRKLQELAVVRQVPQNQVPYNLLNMRSIVDGKVTKDGDGRPWSKAWKHDVSRCQGYDKEIDVMKHKKDLLPCYPSTVIYGHAASRGLDIKRWSIGLDSGCVYGRRLTALILGPKLKKRADDADDDVDANKDEKTIPFGEKGRGRIVSIPCS
ncbi:Serine/threonine-protein phosphatase 1 [Hypsizygus marmoreus]|uniref:Serine/threonine-protein phosphatase 1 n=1 Tax=Hypsizygus marmoreus TaxID=39966 RepID=A0A369JZM3_HYPMA|nr:Serine/threonine-protein phosphatase 1 [Hypsizygus marmoreus]